MVLADSIALYGRAHKLPRGSTPPSASSTVMNVAVSVFELHIPASRGLKDKRRVAKGLMERIHQRYRVSIAETDYHDLHQRTEIAIAVVHRDRQGLEKLLEGVRRMVEQTPEAQLLGWEPQFLEDGE